MLTYLIALIGEGREESPIGVPRECSNIPDYTHSHYAMANTMANTGTMANICPHCMANMDMAGLSHRCIPKPAVVPSKARSVPKAGVAVARSIRDGDGASTQPATYKYRDAEKRWAERVFDGTRPIPAARTAKMKADFHRKNHANSGYC